MLRKPRRITVVISGAAVLVALALLGLYLALRHEPAFYREAMEIKPAVLEKASDRMLKKVTSLENAVNQRGRWQAVITAEEINGWLAVDLLKNHPNTLPPTVHDPRVAIDPNGITAACRYEGAVTTVLSLTLRPYVPEQNVVALRIVRARAGALPVPLKGVLDGLSKAAADMQRHSDAAADRLFRLEWRQAGSDPVAMLSLPEDDNADRVVRIETLELRQGEIRVVGVTERRKPSSR